MLDHFRQPRLFVSDVICVTFFTLVWAMVWLLGNIIVINNYQFVEEERKRDHSHEFLISCGWIMSYAFAIVVLYVYAFIE
jgi:hypothetical protein